MADDAFTRIFGGRNVAQNYGDIINRGYENLNQPLHDSSDRSGVTVGFIQNLANTYADQYLKKNGSLPTDEVIKDFVVQNATPGNASKFITGSFNPDQIAQLANFHIQSNPAQSTSTQQAPAVGTLQDLNTRLPGLYDQLRGNIRNYADTAYAMPRKQAIEDEAALGRLRSPASIPTIANVDIAKANALSSGLAGVDQSQIAGETDLSKALAGVQQEQEKIGNQAQQFGQNFGLANRQFLENQDINSFNQNLANRQLSMAQQLGRMQADQQGNGLSGGLGGAMGGAATGAAIGGTAHPLLGGLIGAGIGGLAGYFGSRR